MAAAAENFASFPEPEGYVRPPEAETYGRSLSRMRRFGVFIIRHTLEAALRSREADQVRVEFDTSVKEGFGTDLELGGGLEVREFDERPVVDGRVMAKDGKTAISGLTEAGLDCALETASKDEHFWPQLVRSEWDHHNALICDQMVRGETDYNTRIVFSPFPEEAAARSGNAYWRKIGYVPHLKRGFVQLYHATEHGSMLTGSLSFDGSNKQRLRELFGRCGIAIPEGEVTDNWLKYAITDTLSKEQAKALATGLANMAQDPAYNKRTNTVAVTEKYAPLTKRVFDESYAHVCESLARQQQTEGARVLIMQLAGRAGNFNQHYASALYRMRANQLRFTDDDAKVLHDLLVYSTIEMMRALHLTQTALQRSAGYGGYQSEHYLPAQLLAASAASFQNMLGNFGVDGAKNNRGYSACGTEIFAGGNDTENSPQSAFGGQDKTPDDEDDLGSRWFTCQKGHLNYRRVANVPEKVCRTCAVDVSCAPPKPSRPVEPKASAPITWEQVFGIKPQKLEGLKSGVGKQALVGAGKP